ncbi:MAG TPA: AMP-binding protein [Clostridiaceae bacterium]|nr:AMP-binding protein [Clostridiaceae bacterium]
MQKVTGKQWFKARSYKTLNEMLQYSFREFPDNPCVRYRINPKDGPITVKYRQMESDILALQYALHSLGIENGKIAVIGENSYFWMLAYLAAVLGAGTIVPLDRMLKGAEIAPLVKRAEVDLIFYDISYHDTIVEIAKENDSLHTLVMMQQGRGIIRDREQILASMSDPNAASAVKDSSLQADAVEQPCETGAPGFINYTFEDFIAFGYEEMRNVAASLRLVEKSCLEPQIENAAVGDLAYLHGGFNFNLPPSPYEFPDPDASRILIFTSGTTDLAKGVQLSHRAITADIEALAGVVKFDDTLRSLSILPLHHSFENTCGFLCVLYFGGCIHICDGLRYVQQNAQEYEVDMIIGVPAIFDAFYNRIQTAIKKEKKEKLVRRMIKLSRGLRKIGIDLRRVFFKDILAAFGGRLWIGIAGGAAMNEEVIVFFEDIGFRILEGYGLTETAPVVAGCNLRLFKPGTVGHPLTGIEVAIDSDDPKEPGEILIRGPILMNGYLNDPEATAEAIDGDGWFHSGDLGLINPKDDTIKITGRLKSMIVLESGKKIFPEEIESALKGHEFIKETMVYGIEDSRGSTIISAKIVLDEEKLDSLKKQGDDMTVRERLDEVIRVINAQMPTFKSIKTYFYGTKEMVKTTTMKIKRNVEIENIKSFMQKHKLGWTDMNRLNLDEIESAGEEELSELIHDQISN